MKKYHYDIEENEVKKEIRNNYDNSNQKLKLNSERINIKKAATFPNNKPEKKMILLNIIGH